MNKRVVAWMALAVLMAAASGIVMAAVRGPGLIVERSGVRYGDGFDYIAVVSGDSVWVHDVFSEVRVADTLEVVWEPQGETDLAGFTLRFIGSSVRQEEFYGMETVEIDTMIHAGRKLYLTPGVYYIGVDAVDKSGNRSALSVAVVLGVKPAGLLPPRRVRIVLGGAL